MYFTDKIKIKIILIIMIMIIVVMTITYKVFFSSPSSSSPSSSSLTMPKSFSLRTSSSYSGACFSIVNIGVCTVASYIISHYKIDWFSHIKCYNLLYTIRIVISIIIHLSNIITEIIKFFSGSTIKSK